MNKKAYYGQFGGQYVAESLMNTLQELDQAYEEAIHDPEFMKQYHYYLKQYVGRETPLYYAERLSAKYGTKIYLKREDLNHTGVHGSWRSTDLLCYLCGNAVRGDEKCRLSGRRTWTWSRGCHRRIENIFPCTGTSGSMERSVCSYQ